MESSFIEMNVVIPLELQQLLIPPATQIDVPPSAHQEYLTARPGLAVVVTAG